MTNMICLIGGLVAGVVYHAWLQPYVSVAFAFVKAKLSKVQ